MNELLFFFIWDRRYEKWNKSITPDCLLILCLSIKRNEPVHLYSTRAQMKPFIYTPQEHKWSSSFILHKSTKEAVHLYSTRAQKKRFIYIPQEHKRSGSFILHKSTKEAVHLYSTRAQMKRSFILHKSTNEAVHLYSTRAQMKRFLYTPQEHKWSGSFILHKNNRIYNKYLTLLKQGVSKIPCAGFV